jgi:hypothetical protein
MERIEAEALRLDCIDDDRSWRCTEIAGDIITRLLDLPAPDLKAALWKFDYLSGFAEGSLSRDDGTTPAWTAYYIRGAVLDVRRFLGGEA